METNLKPVDGWIARKSGLYEEFVHQFTSVTSYEDGSIEVCEDVPGHTGYCSRTHLSLVVISELLRVQGYKIVKDPG